MKSLSRVQLLATPWTVAYQAPLSMGFSRQEYWSGVPLPWPLGKLKQKNSQRLGCSHGAFSHMSPSGALWFQGSFSQINYVAVLGFHCFMWAFSLVAMGAGGYSPVALSRLLIAVAPPVAEPGSRVHGLCSWRYTGLVASGMWDLS